MIALENLTDADLQALAVALRTGRLHPPYTPIALQRFCPSTGAVPIARALQDLHEDGMQGKHIALLVETMVSVRSRHRCESDVVDLVWTGPETVGATNRDTGVVVRDLFGSAHREVLVAGFAVHQGRSVFKRLTERMEELPELHVQLYLDIQRPLFDMSADSELIQQFRERFCRQEWPGVRYPEVYYDPRSLSQETQKRSALHAKCIVIDGQVSLVSSANLTEAAQTRNIEVGVLVQSAAFATRLVNQFQQLTHKKMLLPLSLPT